MPIIICPEQRSRLEIVLRDVSGGAYWGYPQPKMDRLVELIASILADPPVSLPPVSRSVFESALLESVDDLGAKLNESLDDARTWRHRALSAETQLDRAKKAGFVP